MFDRGGLTSKVVNKICRTAFRCDPIYRIAKSCASRRNDSLPSIPDAKRILCNASPRPAFKIDVEPRKWPLVPLVDISVVVPCFNAEKFIEACIRSIACQRTERSFEIVAVDDGSKDATGSILDAMAGEITGLKVIHQDNRGFSGARNVGIANASGGVLSLLTLMIC